MGTETTSFTRFTDTIQLACPLVVWAQCGSLTLKLKKTDGTLFDAFCTVTENGTSLVGTVTCKPTLFTQTGVYNVLIEATLTRTADG